MRSPVLLLATFVCGLAAFGAPVASAAPHHDGPSVSILATAYGSPKLDVLAGDTVTWHNDSVRAHTVSAVDGSFDSARLGVATSFAHKFATAGVVGYYCQIHPFMRAEVDVHRLMLDAPRNAGAPGQPLAVTGRAALPAGTPVSIKAADGTVAATTTVSAAGGISATVRPRVSTSYTAVAGADASPPVQILVLDRKVKASARRAHRGRAVVRARVVPGAPGATVVLQLHLKEHFGWWPVKHVRLDHHSRARFVVRVSHKVRARVVLTAADGATPLARSPVVKLRPR
jgi:plastocyanin